MLDRDIRPHLRSGILGAFPGAVLFDEMRLCRTGRADVAAVDSCLRGYEIKSDSDSLRRLEVQVGLYDRIFDYSIIVTGDRYRRHAPDHVPGHWGIYFARDVGGAVEMEPVRKAKRNAAVSAHDLVRLLWRSEGIGILRANGVMVPHGTRVRSVWEALLKLKLSTIRLGVIRALKGRGA